MRSVNTYSSTLASGVTAGATSFSVASATGLPSEGDFYLNVDAEIVKVTHRSGTTLTVIRAQADTSAASHSSGAPIVSIATADEFYERMNEVGQRKCLPFGRCMADDGTVLIAANFTLRNTGTGTAINDGADGILRLRCKTHGSNEISGATRNFTSASDYRITAHVSCPGIEGTGLASPTPEYFGLASRQSTAGTIHGIWLRPGSFVPTGPNWGKVRVDNRTDFSSGFSADATSDICGRRDMWFRLEVEWNTSGSDDDLRWYYSFDGVHWVLLHTHSFASESLQVGVWGNNDLGPSGKRYIINSWLEEAVTF